MCHKGLGNSKHFGAVAVYPASLARMFVLVGTLERRHRCFSAEAGDLCACQSESVVDTLPAADAEQLADPPRWDLEPVRALEQPQLRFFTKPPEADTQDEPIEQVGFDHRPWEPASVPL
ncbi:hypothetical protein PSD17_03780 [Pseudonocardia sp. D17]|nr:hypothetical protein PSD17_03780 [Pseudonocardia sp. D17]